MSEVAIKVDHVSKSFKLPHERHSSLKSVFVNIFKRKKTYEKQVVLKDVSFEIKRGEFFGIVGRNGSGKSTLLKLLAGVYSPNAGAIHINGKLTPFIELGVGFNPELTGHENVYLNGALLGFDRKEMNEMYDEIVDFAELEKFMDQKLKNYSSGMQVRLAFSIAIRAKSDILLLDEVLAVGDASFQTKCFNYFYELKKRGATVVFVSHDRSSLERFCTNGVLVDKGILVKKGKIRDVLSSYSEIVLEELTDTSSPGRSEVKAKSQYAQIEKTITIDQAGKNKKRFTYGEKIDIEFIVRALRDIDNPVIGVTIWKRNVEEAVYAANTLIEGIKETGRLRKGKALRFRATLPPYLNDGEYRIEPAVANEAATILYDQQPTAANFFINGSKNPHALISAKPSIIIEHQ